MVGTVLICEIAKHVGSQVELNGWVANLRSSGKISFIQLRDGTGFIQCVAVHKQLIESSQAALQEITLESSVSLRGVVSVHPKHANEFELQVSEIKPIQIAPPYPLGRKDHGPDFLLQNRHLWLRSPRQVAIQKIRHTIIGAVYDFLGKEHFTKIDAPIITANACEGTTTLFEFDYFDLGKGYLSQSGQLYLEAAIAAHGRVFDFGPVFRAEKSKTKKHLTEFWMMDAEMAFCDHQGNMALQERLISYIVAQVLENHEQDLALLERDTSILERIKTPFVRITHREAVALLQRLGSDIDESKDLGAGDEVLLAKEFDQPIFIERWPAATKAFYMKRDPEDGDLVLGSDLMAPEGFGEISGGSQREDSFDLLKSRMEEEALSIDTFSWYLDLRRYGSVPHSGFGFGLERIVTWLTGAAHIRETIPFPRMIYRFTP